MCSLISGLFVLYEFLLLYNSNRECLSERAAAQFLLNYIFVVPSSIVTTPAVILGVAGGLC